MSKQASFPPPKDVIPHRDPFLFIQNVIACDDEAIVATYHFTDDSFFAGHFPDNPVVPGVILVEGLAQSLAYLALMRTGPGTVLLTGIEGCKIRHPVRPGDEVTYRVKIIRHRLKMVVAEGTVSVGQQHCVKVTLKGFVSQD